VTGIEDPIEFELTVRTDTDHSWKFRRKDSAGTPLVPSSARAQIRSAVSDTLWEDLSVTIAVDGWITVSLPHVDTDELIWAERSEGKWDLLVTYGDKIYRWVEGPVVISVSVTQ
jgi:hypothetical protein